MYPLQQDVAEVVGRLTLTVIYCAGNISLNALNWLWFSKMVNKMISRLSGETKAESAKVVDEKQPLLAQVDATVTGQAAFGENEKITTEEEKEERAESADTLALPANPPVPVKLKRRPESDVE